jgi:hypothetical protein
MASLTFSVEAEETIALLPRDRELLTGVWKQLELAAEDPAFYTIFPPPFPHRQDRRLFDFRVDDSNGDEWAFSVLFSDEGDQMRVTRFDFNKTEAYPDSGSDLN